MTTPLPAVVVRQPTETSRNLHQRSRRTRSVLSLVPSGYPAAVATLPTMLAEDRRRAGWSVEQAARRLGVSIGAYRELEAGDRSPNFETWDRICRLFGWAQTFPSGAQTLTGVFPAHADVELSQGLR